MNLGQKQASEESYLGKICLIILLLMKLIYTNPILIILFFVAINAREK